VIETVSVFVSLPSGGKAVFVFVQVGNTNFYLPLTSSSANHCTRIERVQLYADPGSIVHAGWQRDTTSVSAMATPHDAPTCEDRQKCWSGLVSGATALG